MSFLGLEAVFRACSCGLAMSCNVSPHLVSEESIAASVCIEGYGKTYHIKNISSEVLHRNTLQPLVASCLRWHPKNANKHRTWTLRLVQTACLH